MSRLVAPLIVCVLLGCSPAPTPTQPPAVQAPAPAVPSVIYVVRHAEKGTDDPRDPDLTPEGRERAQCLAKMLADAEIGHVFATELKRTQNTVAPLAEARSLDVVTIPAAEPDVAARRMLALGEGSRVLYAGHSNTVPTIVEELGGEMTDLNDKGYIEHATYDRLTVVITDGTGPATTLQLRFCQPGG